MRKRNRQQLPESSPQRIQRRPASWASEFGLSEGQKDSLIQQQTEQLESFWARGDSFAGALRVIQKIRSEDAALVDFCDAVLRGKVKYTANGIEQ